MRKSIAMLVCGIMVLAGVMAFLAPADAGRRGGARGHHYHHARAHRAGHRHHAAHRGLHRSYATNRNYQRNHNANRRIVYRNGVRGYWRNGRWIAVPLAAGAGVVGAGHIATCAYEYNRWQATGSAYWRNRYNQCAGIGGPAFRNEQPKTAPASSSDLVHPLPGCYLRFFGADLTISLRALLQMQLKRCASL